MIEKKRYVPHTYKVMLPYLLLVLITDVLIGWVSYKMLIESRTEMIETNIRTSLKQSSNIVRYQMDEIERISETLFGSMSFQRALQKKGDPVSMYITMLDEIYPQMNAPLNFFANPLRIILYTSNEDLLELTGDNMEGEVVGRNYFVLPVQSISSYDWFLDMQKTSKDNYWLQAETDGPNSNISHVRRMVSYSDYRTVIGYVKITASLEDMLGTFNDFPVQDNISVRFVEHSAGDGVSGTLYQQGTAQENSPLDHYLVLEEPVQGTDYRIEALVPNTYLTRDAGKLRSTITMICLASFLGMGLIGVIVARLSGRKMVKILTMIRSFQEGNFQKRIRFSSKDEFAQIADSFNEMAENVQLLMVSVYEQGQQKKQAELEALQAQINPHFLYNTLSTISSLANMGEIGKVTRMVQELSRFYRLTLNQGNVHLSVEQELEQVLAYLDIQRVRYADAFKVYVDVDPEIMQVQIIKLILQPFVENVFKHAWFGETIAIRITGARVGDQVELKIIDNGIGMKPDTVKKLMEGNGSPTDGTGGYGVLNVFDRIRLRYGEIYGGDITSIYGGGTTVRLFLPAYDKHEEIPATDEKVQEHTEGNILGGTS